MSQVKDKNSNLIARRWAKALIELTQENSGISKEEILSDLREVGKNIESNSELKEMFNNPSISTSEKQVIISKLFQNRLLPLAYNFIFSINLKKRINLIDAIADEFEKEIQKFNNVINVDITSAIELNENIKESIKVKIAEKLNKEINAIWNVDSELIAGLKFNINEIIIDNSVKYKLEKLSKEIIIGVQNDNN